jgi:hypothetical protein
MSISCRGVAFSETLQRPELMKLELRHDRLCSLPTSQQLPSPQSVPLTDIVLCQTSLRVSWLQQDAAVVRAP